MRVPLIRSKIEIDHKGGMAKSGLKVLLLDTDHWKSWVHEKLRWPGGEPGSWYLPHDVDQDYCRQILSEVRQRSPSGKVRWVQKAEQNHFLDLEAMQAAASHLLNAARVSGHSAMQPQSSDSDEDSGPGREQTPEEAQPGPPAPEPNRPYRNWMRPREERW